MVTLVVSDVHIGYENSSVDQFKSFVGEVAERTDVENFVILGDVVDMWRRDVSGLFLENYEIVESLIKMKNNKISVYYIVGNHDYHLLKLEDHNYPFEFQRDVQLEISDVSYVFKHGWEFDPIQHEETCEALCHNLSDTAGNERSELWNFITSSSEIKKHIDGIKDKIPSGKGDPKARYINYVTSTPNERFKSGGLDVRIVERNAKDSLKEGEVLVFGHTHFPFVTPDKRLINTGSWVSEGDVYNTYAEIDGQEVRLMQYGKGDITESVTKNV